MLVNFVLLRVEVLHQHYLVTALVVNQLIGNLLDQQNAKTAGPHAHLIAELRVAQRFFRRIADSGVCNGVEREAGAGVANFENQHTRGPHQAEFDFSLRIEPRAVLNGITQQFVGRERQVFAKIGRQVGQLGPHISSDALARFARGGKPKPGPCRRRGIDLDLRIARKNLSGVCHYVSGAAGVKFETAVLMRTVSALGIIVLAALPVSAGKKVISPQTSAGNELVDLVATISLTEEEVTSKLGADPGKGIVLLQVRITPKTGKAVDIDPDDFILLAHDDGERSKPFTPSEIAGQGALVVTSSSGTKVKKTGTSVGIGGIMGGSGGSPGNSKVTTLSSKMDARSQGNDALLEVLKAKQLPQKESNEPVEGFLYFPLDGKHKLKNLAVLYRGRAGRLDLEFEH